MDKLKIGDTTIERRGSKAKPQDQPHQSGQSTELNKSKEDITSLLTRKGIVFNKIPAALHAQTNQQTPNFSNENPDYDMSDDFDEEFMNDDDDEDDDGKVNEEFDEEIDEEEEEFDDEEEDIVPSNKSNLMKQFKNYLPNPLCSQFNKGNTPETLPQANKELNQQHLFNLEGNKNKTRQEMKPVQMNQTRQEMKPVQMNQTSRKNQENAQERKQKINEKFDDDKDYFDDFEDEDIEDVGPPVSKKDNSMKLPLNFTLPPNIQVSRSSSKKSEEMFKLPANINIPQSIQVSKRSQQPQAQDRFSEIDEYKHWSANGKASAKLQPVSEKTNVKIPQNIQVNKLPQKPSMEKQDLVPKQKSQLSSDFKLPQSIQITKRSSGKPEAHLEGGSLSRLNPPHYDTEPGEYDEDFEEDDEMMMMGDGEEEGEEEEGVGGDMEEDYDEEEEEDLVGEQEESTRNETTSGVDTRSEMLAMVKKAGTTIEKRKPREQHVDEEGEAGMNKSPILVSSEDDDKFEQNEEGDEGKEDGGGEVMAGKESSVDRERRDDEDDVVGREQGEMEQEDEQEEGEQNFSGEGLTAYQKFLETLNKGDEEGELVASSADDLNNEVKKEQLDEEMNCENLVEMMDKGEVEEPSKKRSADPGEDADEEEDGDGEEDGEAPKKKKKKKSAGKEGGGSVTGEGGEGEVEQDGGQGDIDRSKVASTALRKNIREVMDETQLDEATLSAQREEIERLKRVQEQQKIIREVQKQMQLNKHNQKTQNKILSLLRGNSQTSILKTSSSSLSSAAAAAGSAGTSGTSGTGSVVGAASGQQSGANSDKVVVKLGSGGQQTTLNNRRMMELLKVHNKAKPPLPKAIIKDGMVTPSVTIAPVVKKEPLVEERGDADGDGEQEEGEGEEGAAGKKKKGDVVTLSSDSEDDCIVLSEEEESEPEEDPTNSGMHTDDKYNVPDEQGRVIINVGHPDGEPDVYLAPQIAKIIKPHQIGGVRFLYDNLIESLERFNNSTGFGCILAHSMGLGKTLQIISFADVFLRHTSAKTVLVIMPINTLQNWMTEFNMWLPKDKTYDEMQPRTFDIFVLNDSLKNLQQRANVIKSWHQNGGVLLMGYELFRQLSFRKCKKKKPEPDASTSPAKESLHEEIDLALVKPGPDLVICDEGHRIKNSHASISQALKQMKTKRRVVLTGYPLQNNLIEYWCMVDFVRPNYLGSKTEFCNMFERPIQNGQCIDSTPQDKRLMRFRAHVLHSLLEGFVQRRSHAVLQAALPQKEEYVLLLRFTSFQRKLYDTFMNEVVRTTAVPNPLKAFAVCCKIWNHPDVLYNFLKKKAEGEEYDLDLEEAIAPPNAPVIGPFSQFRTPHSVPGFAGVGGAGGGHLPLPLAWSGRGRGRGGGPGSRGGKIRQPTGANRRNKQVAGRAGRGGCRKPAASIPPVNVDCVTEKAKSDTYPGPVPPYNNTGVGGQFGNSTMYQSSGSCSSYETNQQSSQSAEQSPGYSHDSYSGTTQSYPDLHKSVYQQRSSQGTGAYDQQQQQGGRDCYNPQSQQRVGYQGSGDGYHKYQQYPTNQSTFNTSNSNFQQGGDCHQYQGMRSGGEAGAYTGYSAGGGGGYQKQPTSENYHQQQQQQQQLHLPKQTEPQQPNTDYNYQQQQQQLSGSFSDCSEFNSSGGSFTEYNQNSFNNSNNNFNSGDVTSSDVVGVKNQPVVDPLPSYTSTYNNNNFGHGYESNSGQSQQPGGGTTGAGYYGDSQQGYWNRGAWSQGYQQNYQQSGGATDGTTTPRTTSAGATVTQTPATDTVKQLTPGVDVKDDVKPGGGVVGVPVVKGDASGEEKKEEVKSGGAGAELVVKKEDLGIPYDWATELFKNYVYGQISNSPKMVVFFYLLNESIAIKDRILVFSQSLLTLDLIEDYLHRYPIPSSDEKWFKNRNYFRLDGSTPALEREKLINEFNANDKIHLFLVSTRAGSLGINLVGANRVIVFDASWNPCHDTQAVCRVYRYGQQKPCYVYRLVLDNCLEKKIYDRQINKQGMADRVVDELNPDAHLSLKEVTNLCWDDTSDTEVKDFSHLRSKYNDDLIRRLVDDHSKVLSKEPFQHESLLIDRKEKKLSQAEKRLAKRSYELEKQAANQPKNIYSFLPNPMSNARNFGKPIASVRPMQSELSINRVTTLSNRSKWITADVWQRQGMSAQEMTLPLDVVIPTNSPDKTSIVLKAGQRVMVLKSPKGIYMQLENGKIIAIRTAFKVSGKPQEDGKKTEAASTSSSGSGSTLTLPLARSLKNNPAITITSKNQSAMRGGGAGGVGGGIKSGLVPRTMVTGGGNLNTIVTTSAGAGRKISLLAGNKLKLTKPLVMNRKLHNIVSPRSTTSPLLPSSVPDDKTPPSDLSGEGTSSSKPETKVSGKQEGKGEKNEEEEEDEEEEEEEGTAKHDVSSEEEEGEEEEEEEEVDDEGHSQLKNYRHSFSGQKVVGGEEEEDDEEEEGDEEEEESGDEAKSVPLRPAVQSVSLPVREESIPGQGHQSMPGQGHQTEHPAPPVAQPPQQQQQQQQPVVQTQLEEKLAEVPITQTPVKQQQQQPATMATQQQQQQQPQQPQQQTSSTAATTAGFPTPGGGMMDPYAANYPYPGYWGPMPPPIPYDSTFYPPPPGNFQPHMTQVGHNTSVKLEDNKQMVPPPPHHNPMYPSPYVPPPPQQHHHGHHHHHHQQQQQQQQQKSYTKAPEETKLTTPTAATAAPPNPMYAPYPPFNPYPPYNYPPHPSNYQAQPTPAPPVAQPQAAAPPPPVTAAAQGTGQQQFENPYSAFHRPEFPGSENQYAYPRPPAPPGYFPYNAPPYNYPYNFNPYMHGYPGYPMGQPGVTPGAAAGGGSVSQGSLGPGGGLGSGGGT